MIVAFKGSFLRDVSSLRDRQVKNEIRNIIQQVKEAPHVSQIQRLVKLRK